MLDLTPRQPAAPLRLDGVSKTYLYGPTVIDGLSHTFEPGTATAIVGPNGSGKSTLLRMLTVLSRPNEGRVLYGEPPYTVHDAPHRYLASVGIVHDGADLPGYLTATEALAWIARARGLWDDDASPAAHAALLDDVLLDERRDALIRTYSAGMTRKTQLATALVARPSVLILDEPFRALDTEATARSGALLAAFRDAGGTVVVSSHRADLLAELCDARLDLGAAPLR